MEDETAFLRAIADEPVDDAPKLVFADWLDERDDARGEYFRLLLVLEKHGGSDRWESAVTRLRELHAALEPEWCELVGQHALRRRRPLWSKLADLFVSYSQGDIHRPNEEIASEVISSGYGPSEVRLILWREVFPSTEWNLRNPIPVDDWTTGFYEEWMQRLVFKSVERYSAAEQLQEASRIQAMWVEVCRFLPSDYQICGKLFEK